MVQYCRDTVEKLGNHNPTKANHNKGVFSAFKPSHSYRVRGFFNTQKWEVIHNGKNNNDSNISTVLLYLLPFVR